MRERGDQTLEQFDEPLAGHADGVDDGQGDEPGDEAVFNGGGGALVTQKFPEHSFLAIFTKTVWHAQVAVITTELLKLRDFLDASAGCRAF
jgi:hypothetical protein